MEDVGLGRTTGLALVDELTRVVDHASGFLTSVRLHTRGLLRAGVPAEHLLERWAEGFRARWAGRGITLELVVEPHLHARRCVLQGTGEAIEVALEWGLGWHIDTTANAILDPARRAAKRTELLILAHTGTWHDHTLHAAQLETAGHPPGCRAAPECLLRHALAERRSQLARLLRRLLAASRRKSWHGRVRCMRCRDIRPAQGAMVQLAGGRIQRVDLGGAHCQVALYAGLLSTVQCAECASSRHGRGRVAGQKCNAALMGGGACLRHRPPYSSSSVLGPELPWSSPRAPHRRPSGCTEPSSSLSAWPPR